MKNKISIIVFWGSLWGLAEATLGYLLHLLPVNIGWLVWFPLAYIFMRIIRERTGSNTAVIYAAIIAAGIKFVDIMMPGSIDRVVNPAIAIILEALCVSALFSLIIGGKPALLREAVAACVASFTWRLLYIGYISVLPDWMVKISPVADLRSAFSFILVQSAINAVEIVILLTVYYCVIKQKELKLGTETAMKASKMKLPVFAYMLLVLAIAVQRFL